MEYFSNEGKNVDIELNRKTYKRHVIKIDPINVDSNIYEIIKKYVVPIYKKGDVLYISKKLASICSDSYIHKNDIKVGKLALKLATRISLLPGKNVVANSYAMQVAIYMEGIFKVMWAWLIYGRINKRREKFIEAAGTKIGYLSGLDGSSFSQYENIIIMPPINGADICYNIRKDLGITCFIASVNNNSTKILNISRDLRTAPLWKLEKIISDNPLGEGNLCTPLCLVRNENANENIDSFL